MGAEPDGGHPEILGIGGSGPMLYALAHAAAWAHQRPAGIIAAAERAMDHVEAAIASDQNHDIISGCAGTICCLLAWESVRPGRALRIARTAGDQLLAQAQDVDGGLAWTGPAWPLPTTGFAHGSDGIAYALMRLAAATGSSRYLDAALAAVRFSRAKYCPDIRNWPDERDWVASRDTRTWCYGAPGIGLARCAQLRLGFGDAQTVHEIRDAFHATAASSPVTDGLCHGRFGNSEALSEIAATLGDHACETAAAAYKDSAIAGLRTRGAQFDAGTETLNLMLGFAGIGYALLRAHEPGLPCVLLLGPPASRSS